MHFIAGGDPEKDLEFHVARLRDERRFANRRVDVMQDGQLLTTAMVSYLSGGRSLEHGVEATRAAGSTQSLPPIDDLLRGYEDVVPHFVNALRPIDWRYTNDPAWVMRDKGEKLTYNRVWMKAQGADARRPGAARRGAGLLVGHHGARLDHHHPRVCRGGYDRIFAVTTNHSVWFHRPVAVRRLGALLDVVAGGRGFAGPGHGALLRPVGSAAGDRRAGRHRQALPGAKASAW